MSENFLTRKEPIYVPFIDKSKAIAGRSLRRNSRKSVLLTRTRRKMYDTKIYLTNAMQHSSIYIENATELNRDNSSDLNLDREKHTQLSRANYYPFSPNYQKVIRDERGNKSNKTIQGNNMKTSIIHSDDSISTRLFASWITSRYEFSVDKLIKIEENTVDAILNDTRFTKNMKIEGGYTNYLVMNDDILIIINQKDIKGKQERSEAYFELFATNIDTYYEYYNYIMKINKEIKIDTLTIEYHAFSSSQYGGINSNVEYFTKEIFNDVSDVFYEPYLDTDLLFEKFLESRSVMLQLTGKPGIGKSKLIALFVKYLIDNPKQINDINSIKIARPANSEVLAEEDFWVKLRQDGFHALILDDVDHILQKRNETVSSADEKMHNEIIRKILTYTDGLTTQKTKILISTNLEYHKIDQALIRDLRLFDSLELRALHQDEALKIWTQHYKLNEDKFYNVFENAESITSARLSKEIELLQNSSRNGEEETSKSYLKENNISKVSSLQNQKARVGLV